MDHTCSVPNGMETNNNGKSFYTRCGLDATYRCGGWYLCEGHKKYLANKEKWPAERLVEKEVTK